MTNVQFGPYQNFKPSKRVSLVKYKYPWDKITQTGQQYGFFVGVSKKPKPPETLQYRNWKFLPAESDGQKGWYVYVQNFTNGYKPQ